MRYPRCGGVRLSWKHDTEDFEDIRASRWRGFPPACRRRFDLRHDAGMTLEARTTFRTRGHDAGGADGISASSATPRLRHVRHREKGIAPARAHRGDQLGEEPPARPGGARDGGTSALISLAGRRDLRGSMARTKREHTFGETGCKCGTGPREPVNWPFHAHRAPPRTRFRRRPRWLRFGMTGWRDEHLGHVQMNSWRFGPAPRSARGPPTG